MVENAVILLTPGFLKMDSTHTIPDRLNSKRSSGFTVVELLIALTIAVITLAAAYPTMTFLLKSNYALGQATIMAKESRMFAEQLGWDVRSTVDLSSAGSSRMKVITEDPDGIQETITYYWKQDQGILTRKVGSGTARTIMENVSYLKFDYYDSKDLKTQKIIDIKKVQVQLVLKESVMSKEYEWDFKSSRFVMRNRVPG